MYIKLWDRAIYSFDRWFTIQQEAAARNVGDY